MSVAFRLPLQVFYEREARHPHQRFLVQPLGGGQVDTLSWAEAGHQARCAAHWLRARELPPGSHIAIISKNCAHWIIADLAIWMAGHVSVPLYPNLTAEALTPDGFLRTGDKGEQDAQGYLRLTGRLKEIFKTSKGKYVAPAPIENRLAVHTRIEQVCVVGDGLGAPLGLCVLSANNGQDTAGPARDRLRSSLETLLEEVNQVLEKHERLRSLVVVKDSWAVENGFLTPTLKIKRNVIESTYGLHFAAWSERSEAVLWQD